MFRGLSVNRGLTLVRLLTELCVLHFEENRRIASTRKHDVIEYVCILFFENFQLERISFVHSTYMY